MNAGKVMHTGREPIFKDNDSKNKTFKLCE